MQNPFKLLAGRLRKKPARETDIYPRLMQLGGHARRDPKRTTIKPTPTNLRFFSRTPYARRAINAIKNPIKQLAWEIAPVPGVKLNRELQRQIDLLTFCLEHPNQDDSFLSLMEQVIEDYLVVSAGAIEQELGGDPQRPLWLWPVDAQSIQIFPDWSGNPGDARYLQVLGYGNIGLQQGIPLLNDELIYIKPNPSTSTPYGYGPLEIAFRAIARKLGVDDYAGNVATNAQPKNILHFDGADASWVQTFRNYWRDEVEGQGQTPIVGGNNIDGKVLALHGGNDDALYLKYQQFLLREIAAAFDLSPQNLGLEADVNRNTSEVAEDRDWDHAIKPTARQIESHLTRECVQAKLGFYNLRFKFVGLDREDEKATAEIYQIYYRNNLVTPNEHREKLGMPPSDNEFAEMTATEAQIAVAAARGVKLIEDPSLPKQGGAEPPNPNPSINEKE